MDKHTGISYNLHTIYQEKGGVSDTDTIVDP